MARRRQPDAYRGLTLLVALVLLLVFWLRSQQTKTPPQPGVPGTYLFCFWNVENFFDDHFDNRPDQADVRYDEEFANQPNLLERKLERLSYALLQLNDGKGPDILAVCEVESERAAELLADALNKRLSDPTLHYQHVLMKENKVGRHIAPAILTRLPVEGNRTRGFSPHRILEGHVNVAGCDLVLFACHWSSRISDKTGQTRAKYADQVYGEFKAMDLSNPHVDCLICGDFNDPPDAPSVTDHLHAVGDPGLVRQSRPPDPLLLDLMAGKDPAAGWGTLYYDRSWSTFDQIVISPGLLDQSGWACDRDSVQVVNWLTHPGDKNGAPWRFDDRRYPGEKGFSDHFPVTVRLRCPGGPEPNEPRP